MNPSSIQDRPATTTSDVEVELKPEMTDEASKPAPCDDQSLELRIEALLLGSDRPLTESRLAELVGLSGSGTAKTLREAIETLNETYTSSGRSFRVEKLAGGWQLLTLPQFGPLMALMYTERQSSKLSQAALETLSIIAYRQPIIRAEIEAIRGVACGEVLRGLLERRLIKIVGRAEELGRPMLYGTTKEFLKVFGLARLADLPEVDGLSPASTPRAPSSKPAETADENPADVAEPPDEPNAEAIDPETTDTSDADPASGNSA